MALVLGGAVAIGIGGLVVYDNLADYSDCGDYSDYGDYSDAQVRRARRAAQLKKDIEKAALELSEYKTHTLNPELSSQYLKEKAAMEVSGAAMDKEAREKIEKQKDNELKAETRELREDLERIEELLRKIKEIEENLQ